MINFNLYQYNREIEVVVQDEDNNATMTQYLGNMPMYDTTHKLHKGIDNTLRFKFRDTKLLYRKCMTEVQEKMYFSNT